MHRTRNRQRRFYTTIREETWTYKGLTLFDGPNSDAHHRPHLRRETLKNPRYTTRKNGDDRYEEQYDQRGRKRFERRMLREHMDARYDDGIEWVKERQEYYADLPWAYAWHDLADWERELLGNDPIAYQAYRAPVLVDVRTVWRQRAEEELPDIRPRPAGSRLMYTTETPRQTRVEKHAKSAKRVIEHYHGPSHQTPGGAGIINAINRSTHRGDIPRVERMRVWELARQVGLTSKDLVKHLRDTGEYVRTSASAVESPVVRRILADLGPKEAN